MKEKALKEIDVFVDNLSTETEQAHLARALLNAIRGAVISEADRDTILSIIDSGAAVYDAMIESNTNLSASFIGVALGEKAKNDNQEEN